VDPLFVVMFVVVAAVAVFAFYAAAKRRKELAAWAHGHGLSFDRSKRYYVDDRFAEFKCLRKGHSRYAYNTMKGNWGETPIVAFDYHYAIGSGKNRSDHNFSAAIVDSPIPLKGLFIRPEGFFDKVTEFFGFDDIDFESAEFSRKFYVTSPDKRWAYDVIHQQMMEYLMSVQNFCIQFGPTRVIAWRSRRFKPADFEAAIAVVRGMLERLPEYVIRRQTGEG